MISIDRHAYASRLAAVSPKTKIIFSMLPMVICIFFNGIGVSMLTILIMGVASVKYGGLKFPKYFKLMLIPLGFLLIGTLTILVNRFEQGHAVLLGINAGSYAYGIDAASALKSARLVLKALGAVSCMYFLSLNTPMADLFQVLNRTKLPPVAVQLMELIYRYIFVLLEEMQRMNIAKDSRLGNRNFTTAMKATGELAGMLFLRAYRRSDRIYAALESRGYDGNFSTLEQQYTHSKKMNTASLAVCCILLAAGIAEWMVL